MAADGGDWDRRNRLKVYTALTKLLARDVKEAAGLLIDCIATFSCSELCSYQDFIVYVIISNLLHLPRTDLKEKIIDGPEILTVANDIPTVVSVEIHTEGNEIVEITTTHLLTRRSVTLLKINTESPCERSL